MMSHANRPTAIEVSGLTKIFGRLRAVDGLDLAVQPGQVHGFLGPNGAGKSTTIRVLLGMYRRDAGTVRVLGMDPRRSPARRPMCPAMWPCGRG